MRTWVPVGGHDVQRLTAVLQAAKEAGRPVLVHVHTVKGSGYDYALREPEKFHGVGPFDPATGKVRQAGKETFSHVFGETLRQLAREDRHVCAITAAMADGTGLTDFAREFPRRFFDVGIAEGHGVAMAGGMAKQGLIPVFAVYDSFCSGATICWCRIWRLRSSMWCWRWTAAASWAQTARHTTAVWTT